MQAIARWGNFFNQELYGPPTTLPWGIPIDCAHRIAAYPCGRVPARRRASTRCSCTSRSPGVIGALVLIWLGFHLRKRLRAGDLLLLFFIWYGRRPVRARDAARGQLDVLRVPTAQVVSIAFVIAVAVVILAVAAPARASARRPADVPGGRDVGCDRAAGRAGRSSMTTSTTTMTYDDDRRRAEDDVEAEDATTTEIDADRREPTPTSTSRRRP